MRSDDPVSEPVVVGRIGGAFGVLGWIRVHSFTDPPANLLDYKPWFIEETGGWRGMTPAASRPHGDVYVVQLRELASREEAQALTGRLIAVPRSALPDVLSDDEFYWRDLIGLEVLDRAGRRLGTVDHLLATGAHDVLVIEAGGASTASGTPQLLIPFLRQFVPEVDLAAGRLVVDWQEPR